MKSLIAVMLLFSSAANAYTVIYDSGNVTAIANLEVGGTLYNVDFETGVYSTFGGSEFFWSTATDAVNASAAINAVLNAEGSPFVNNNPNGDGLIYTVIYSDTPMTDAPIALNGREGSPAEWNTVNLGTEGVVFGVARTAWSVVPIPAAVWLFGSGLAGLGWFGRKRKA